MVAMGPWMAWRLGHQSVGDPRAPGPAFLLPLRKERPCLILAKVHVLNGKENSLDVLCVQHVSPRLLLHLRDHLELVLDFPGRRSFWK